MTKTEFYTAILQTEVSEELKERAEFYLAELKAQNEKKAKKTAEKAQVVNEPLKQAVLEYLTTHENGTSSEIANTIGDVTFQKISAICGLLVEDGKVTIITKKIPTKGTVRAYVLAK